MPSSAYIVDYKRTPFTAAQKGGLRDIRPDDLSAQVLRTLMDVTPIPSDAINDVIWGCAFPEADQGLNIGRTTALLAGLPNSVPGMTVNRWCGSSMQAVQIASGLIATGSGDLVVCGGVESMSRVPMMGFNLSPNPEWSGNETTAYTHMGLTAETVAEHHGIGRDVQDAFALESHRKALAAQAGGRFAKEIVPITVAEMDFAVDGCPRQTTLAKLAALKTVFKDNGTVTAGTSSPMTDGASVVLVCSDKALQTHNLTPLARIAGFAVTGCAPEVMGIGPIKSSLLAMARAGVEMKDIGIVEMNEAFAAQAIVCQRALDIPEDILNIDGGALAIGHPLGATGSRLVGKAAQLLQRENRRFALATQCIGGGMGISVVLEVC